MNKPDAVHKLIQQMSAAEKRYFVNWATHRPAGKKGEQFLVLYEAIRKQEVYDEEQLKKQLKDKQLLARFAEVKHYLYENLLRALGQYHQGRFATYQVRDWLTQADILFRKGLADQAEVLLEKAEDLAHRNEDPYGLLQILDFRRRTVQTMPDGTAGMATLEKLELAESELIAFLDSLRAKMRLYFQFYFRFIETVYARDAETYQWFEAQLSEASFQQHPMGWKIRAETMYRSMAGGYYQLRSDFEQALAQARAGITLYSEMPFQKQQRVGSYKIFVRNALLFKGYLRNYDPEFQALLAELRTPYPTESEVERVINLRSGLIFEVSPYIATGNFKKAAALIPSLEDAIDGHPARYALAEYLLLIFNCFYIQFGLQDWKAASQSLNRLFQEAPPGFRQDLINIAKVLELVVLFEREAFDLLPYKIRSAYRFLRKNASAFGFERLILHFMRGKLLDATDATSLKVNFEQMHTQLAALFEDPYERNVLNYFDFLAWLSAKVTNRPFAEVMQAEASAKGYRCEWVDNQA